MPYELRENSFLMFKNHGKEKNPKAPDYKGEGLINGRAHDAAIWVRQGQRGEFLSMTLKPKEQRQDGPARPTRVYGPAAVKAKPVELDFNLKAQQPPTNDAPPPDDPPDEIPF